MGKTPKTNYEEEKMIYLLDVQKYTDNLIKQSFHTKLRGFSLDDIAKKVSNHFNDTKAYDIAFNYYVKKIGY